MEMLIRIWDVEHGACAMLWPVLNNGQLGRLAMIDSGDNTTERWTPSAYIRDTLGRDRVDYLFITNADQDHLSDLNGLSTCGIGIGTLIRNPQPAEPVLRQIKSRGGPLTADIERFLELHGRYSAPATEPFNDYMGGVTAKWFRNSYPRFGDTNNLSLVVFFTFGEFKILFPGDVEEDGWLALLEQPEFVNELEDTTILVASHHGRRNGYCREIFNYFAPSAVVMSDKSIVHSTQDTVPVYRSHVREPGVYVANTHTFRRVLTTRRDGHISFRTNGRDFTVETECG